MSNLPEMEMHNTQPGDGFGFSSKNQITLSDKSFDSWRKYIYEICGIYFQDNKKYLMESRLQKRISFLGLDSFDAYLDYVKYNPNKSAELRYLYEAITINETFFFRNQPQLDCLVASVIPEIAKNPSKFNKNKIRIWSAASSSGEEAYSIAMTLTDLIKPRFPQLEFEIVGTDINQAMVDTAKKGVYRDYSIRNTPPYYLKKYFKTSGNTYEVDQSIKSMVTFKLLNLYDDMA
ncbi:MAG: CheR family methyltransferase, partial [Syntrophothermus sp.]